MGLYHIRFGEQTELSSVTLKSLTLTGKAPVRGASDSANFFTLNEGKIYLVTEFSAEQTKISHVWYGPEATTTYVGENGRQFQSSIDLHGEEYSPWKVVVFDKDGGVIAARKFVSSAGRCFVLDYPRSRTMAESAVLCSGVRDGEPVSPEPTVNLAFGRLFFVTKFRVAVASPLSHIWIHSATHEQHRLQTRLYKANKVAVSEFHLPSEPIGYWKVIAVDEAGEYVAYRDFHITPIE